MSDGLKLKRIKFIINPISGGIKKAGIEKKIKKEFGYNKYLIDIQYTEHKKHATEIAKKAVDDGFDMVVAVGGDGTVNETARSLINTNTVFGIIPTGSGNGLSRFLKIPMNTDKAIKTLKKEKTFIMDAIRINNEYFVNMAGVGFDALIGHLFADYGKRGFISYLKLIIKEFFRYQNKTYQLVIDGKRKQFDAFLISFANSSQFGNNAHIAPMAEINDGLIDVCILKMFPRWKSFFLAILLYSKGLVNSKYYNLIKTPKVEIINSDELKAHIDGDPVLFNTNVNIEIIPLSLKVAIP